MNAGQVKGLRDFYTYVATATALAAAGNTTTSIQIEADSDFWLQKLSFYAINSASSAAVASPNVRVLLTDTGSSRNLSNSPLPVASFAGTGALPFILPNPRLFRRNSSIQVAFTSFEASIGITLNLLLIGVKHYEASN